MTDEQKKLLDEQMKNFGELYFYLCGEELPIWLWKRGIDHTKDSECAR